MQALLSFKRSIANDPRQVLSSWNRSTGFCSWLGVACVPGTPEDLVGVEGTIGYVAPEYCMGFKVSTGCDVYGFGVLLLEMLTGSGDSDGVRRLRASGDSPAVRLQQFLAASTRGRYLLSSYWPPPREPPLGFLLPDARPRVDGFSLARGLLRLGPRRVRPQQPFPWPASPRFGGVEDERVPCMRVRDGLPDLSRR
ncbi:hypothetical protein ZWY2020_005463 [Hordeum vulgare]|nr:hypothetical protein ZWY2020_005463 [Hordeum vulgare]